MVICICRSGHWDYGGSPCCCGLFLWYSLAYSSRRLCYLNVHFRNHKCTPCCALENEAPRQLLRRVWSYKCFSAWLWKSAKGQRARGKGVMLPLKGLLRADRLKLSCAVLHEVHSLFHSKVYNFRELKNISTAGSHVFGVIEQIMFFHIFPCESEPFCSLFSFEIQ